MILPLLIFLAFGAIEGGRALNQYASLVAIAEEGALVASRISGIEPGTLRSAYDPYSNTSTQVSFASANGTQPPANHSQILNRVTRLIQINHDHLAVSGIQIETKYIKAGTGSGASDDSIAVRIFANYDGLFQATNFVFGIVGWRGLPIKTEAVGPYIDQLISVPVP